LEEKGRNLDGAPWDLNWLQTPVPLESPQGELDELRACRACPAAVRVHDMYDDLAQFCGRPACYDAKLRLWVTQEAERQAKRSHLPLAAPEEDLVPAFDGNEPNAYDLAPAIAKLVQRKPAYLRLVPVIPDPTDDDGDPGAHSRRNALGSGFVRLAVAADHVDEFNAQMAKLTAVKTPRVKVDPKTESSTAKAKRLKEEAAEKEERRAERRLFHHEKYDSLWAIRRAVELIVPHLSVSPLEFLKYTCEEIDEGKFIGADFPDLRAIEGELDEVTEKLEKGKDAAAYGRALLAHMVYVVLVSEIASYGSKPAQVYRFRDVCEQISETALETFGFKLPKHWNKIPIHKTAFNCHHCGVFGSHEGSLTKGELAEGWVVALESNGKTIRDVGCPECTANVKPASKGRGVHPVKSKKKK